MQKKLDAAWWRSLQRQLLTRQLVYKKYSESPRKNHALCVTDGADACTVASRAHKPDIYRCALSIPHRFGF